MKTHIPNYTFDASAQTVTFDDYVTIRLDAVLLIVNVTDQIIIYSFANTGKGGTAATNVLTLEFDTTAMSDTDDLLIYYDDDALGTGGLTDAELRATPVPVSGTVTATGPLTDTQLRATAVPVSGPLTDTQLRATAVPVSGTVAVTGVATAANQATEIASLASIDGKDFATQTTLALIKAKTDNLDVALSTRTKPADAQHVIVDSGVTTGLTDTQLRATPVPVSGTVTATTGGLTDTQLRATAVPVSGPLTDAQLRATAVPVSGTVTASGPLTDTQLRATAVPVSLASVPSHAVTNAGTFAVQSASAGDVAHDSVDSGNPQKIGGKAITANPTAVAALDRTDAIFDKVGRQVVVLGHVRDLISHQYTQVVNSTAETTIVSATASEFHDLLMLTIKSSAAVTATFKDSTGGTTRMLLAASANSQTIPFPVPFPQLAAVNNNWTMTLSNNTTTVDITVMFAKNV